MHTATIYFNPRLRRACTIIGCNFSGANYRCRRLYCCAIFLPDIQLFSSENIVQLHYIFADKVFKLISFGIYQHVISNFCVKSGFTLRAIEVCLCRLGRCGLYLSALIFQRRNKHLLETRRFRICHNKVTDALLYGRLSLIGFKPCINCFLYRLSEVICGFNDFIQFCDNFV